MMTIDVGKAHIAAISNRSEGRDVRRAHRPEDDAPARPLLHGLSLYAGGRQLGQDQPPVVDQVRNAAGLDDRHDVVGGEVPSGRRAPNVDAS
jgi:hypothetical protein